MVQVKGQEVQKTRERVLDAGVCGAVTGTVGSLMRPCGCNDLGCCYQGDGSDGRDSSKKGT